MITTVLFDLGGTLHSVIKKPDSMQRFAARLIARLSDYGIILDVSPEALAVSLHENGEAYKHESERTRRELPSAVIWKEVALTSLRSMGTKEKPRAYISCTIRMSWYSSSSLSVWTLALS